jgi:hypothetical protein
MDGTTTVQYIMWYHQVVPMVWNDTRHTKSC